MSKFDRYMLSQLLLLFSFFALVLASVFWINRAVVLFDRLIGDGQSTLVFLEFTALGLPRLISTVLPLATFAAAVYVTNRLNNESEMVVMQASGIGPWRLARPVLIYGLITAVMMSLLSHLLVPLARAQLSERETEISRNVTSRLLTEGTFLNPTSGVTFYTRTIDEDGVLKDVFLSDRRNPSEQIIYIAAEAYLVNNETKSTLIMVDGSAQRLAVEDNRLSTAKFIDFSFDISSLINSDTAQNTSLRHLRSTDLLSDWDELAKETSTQRGDIAEELHSRFAQSIFCLISAMIGFSTLLLGGFSRFRVWREIAFAFTLLIFVDGLRNTFVDSVIKNADNWPLIYFPALIGGCLSAAFLSHAANPNWWRRGAKA